jgi:integrase
MGYGVADRNPSRSDWGGRGETANRGRAHLGAVDLDAGMVRVERSLEETGSSLRFKPPKTGAGRRAISLPASVAETLSAHRRAQREHRLAIGLGRPGDDDLVFARSDASPHPPDNLSRDWRRTVLSLKLPCVSFHGLRHSHVSALIAAELDVVTISRRIGHANPAVTLAVYAHVFAGASYFPAQKARFRTTVQRIWARGPAGRSRSPPARCEVSGIGITGWAAWPSRG